MRSICAWCNAMLTTGISSEEHTEGISSEEHTEGISHGICPTCAAVVLNDKTLKPLEVHRVETLRMLELLLEMVGDLYEVATALAPKAGVGITPAASVRTWQKQRE